jgi:hypothetical protein
MDHQWVLWYHDPENKDYSLAGYMNLADIGTPEQFWSVVEAIPRDAWDSGMFFFMKAGFKPLWDSPENEGGGAWSKKIEASTTFDTFVDLMVECMSGELLSERPETLAGVTLSPKGPFSIVKIWNTSIAVSKNSILNNKSKVFRVSDDVTYTPHKLRPK